MLCLACLACVVFSCLFLHGLVLPCVSFVVVVVVVVVVDNVLRHHQFLCILSGKTFALNEGDMPYGIDAKSAHLP